MADNKVVTGEGHAEWRVKFFRPPTSYKESESFKIGIWNWALSVHRAGRCGSFSLKSRVDVRLFPRLSAEEPPPHARFSLRMTVDGSNTSTVHEGVFRTQAGYVFPIKIRTYHSKFTIDVFFWELKISPSNGGEYISIWPIDERRREATQSNTLKCFSRMLNESLCTDVTINTTDGKLHAHKAVLSASSPVFNSMFAHDLKEKQSSTIDIEDMTSESCMALLNYMYGNISKEDISKHRLTLIDAANKYNIPDLKDECEESLLKGIGLDNVLERLQEAHLYQLKKLKKGCFNYLIDSGMIYDLNEGINNFFTRADRELVEEIFQQVLGCLKALRIKGK